MDFSLDGGTTWIRRTTNTIPRSVIGNNAIIVYVRHFPTATQPASAIRRVNVPGDPAIPEVNTPELAFDGTAFTLGTVEVLVENVFLSQSIDMRVVIRKHTANGIVTDTHDRRITAAGTVSIDPGNAVNTFYPQYGEYIEIRVYRNITPRQPLLHRQVIQPVVFSFD